jgi:putative ABC transport system permease protein
LTAVDLAGLTRIELAFGLVLAAASAALVLLLGWSQRRRGFAIATALGARTRHLRAFVAADAAVLAGAGLAAGAVAGWVLSEMLVALLTGVFDPPPHTLAVPWMYLDAVGAAIVVAIAAVSASIARLAARTPLATLREL